MTVNNTDVCLLPLSLSVFAPGPAPGSDPKTNSRPELLALVPGSDLDSRQQIIYKVQELNRLSLCVNADTQSPARVLLRV